MTQLFKIVTVEEELGLRNDMPNFFESSLPKTKGMIDYPSCTSNIVIRPGSITKQCLTYICVGGNYEQTTRNRLIALEMEDRPEFLVATALPKITKQIERAKRARNEQNLQSMINYIQPSKPPSAMIEQ